MNSKENGLLHLVGCPIQLSARSKISDPVRRNRPRSAMFNHQTQFNHNSETYEVKSRPLSAGTLPMAPCLTSFLPAPPQNKTFGWEMSCEDVDLENGKRNIQSKHQPMLFERKSVESNISHCVMPQRSFTPESFSDRSEDTYVSLGTKIKAKAQIFGNLKTCMREDFTPINEVLNDVGSIHQLTKNSYLESNDTINTMSLSNENSLQKSTNGTITGNIEDVSNTDADENYAQCSENILTDNYNYNDHEKRNNGHLTGRVSFGALEEPLHSIHFNSYDQSADYRKKLSLVEEESSEGSDEHTKNPSIGCDVNTGSNKNVYNLGFVKEITNDESAEYIGQIGSNKGKAWSNDDCTFRNTEGVYEPILTNNVNSIDDNDIQKQNIAHGSFDLYYPSYLKDSSSKSYTNEVIKEYEKEIAIIDTLHHLTLEDLKNERYSPTRTCGGQDDVSENDLKDKNELTKHQNGNSLNIGMQCDYESDKYRTISNSTNDVIHAYLAVKSDTFNASGNRKLLKKKSTIKKPIKLSDTINKSVSNPQLLNSAHMLKHKAGINKKGYVDSVAMWQDHSASYNAYVGSKKSIAKKNQKLNAQKIHVHPKDAAAKGLIVEIDKDVDSWMSMRAMTPINESSTCEDAEKLSLVPREFGSITEISPNKHVHYDKKCASNSNELNFTLERDKKLEEDKKLECHFEEINTPKEPSEQLDLEVDPPVFNVCEELEETVLDRSPRFSNENTFQTLKEGDSCSRPSADYSDIVSFLDKVEDSANEAITNVTKNQTLTTPKIEFLMKLSTAELAHRIVTNSLQLEEKSCCISLLQESLAQSKQEAAAKISTLEKQCRQTVFKSKQDCEQIVKRHQTFIDRLITDKKTLNNRIEEMVDERRAAEERWRHSISSMEEKHKILIKNQHDKLTASHQLAKQRWVKQKADKIKELTVKGLEGELRDMADKQQRELAAIRIANAQREAALEDKYNNEVKKLKETFNQEMNEAIDNEKRQCSERMEKQMANIEVTYQQQRMRLMAEMRVEGERTISEADEREAQLRRALQGWRESEEKKLQQKEHEMLKEIERKNEELLQENTRLRQSLEANFKKYKTEYVEQQENILKKKEIELQAYFKRERDQEIEKAIESLEQEAEKTRREMQDFVVHTKEQYSLSLKELSDTEHATLSRCQEAHMRLREALDNCSSLEITVAQMEAKIRLSNEENAQLKEEIAKVRGEAITKSSEEKEKLHHEIDVLKKSHNELMHQLYAKVKVAVARKDAALMALEREYHRAKEKIIHLEQRLEQQRKDFFESKR